MRLGGAARRCGWPGNTPTPPGSGQVTDATAARSAAREAAFVDASERATHLAGLAGLELGDVQTIAEGGRDDVFHEAASDARMLSGTVAFEPGKTTIGAALTVTFQLLPTLH